jgi:DNA-binding MarR family transcriptional regulator
MSVLKKPKELQTLHFSDGKLSMNLNSLQQFATLGRQLNNKPRQQVLLALERNSGMTVTDLFNLLKWDQSYTSQMLRDLKNSGLVTSERDGHFVLYSVNKALLLEVRKFLVNIYE